MIDVTLVTCRAHPRLPEDDQFLLASLERRGIRHRVAIWNDPDVDWSESSRDSALTLMALHACHPSQKPLPLISSVSAPMADY